MPQRIGFFSFLGVGRRVNEADKTKNKEIYGMFDTLISIFETCLIFKIQLNKVVEIVGGGWLKARERVWN